jgi:hypothetical protein
MQISYYGGTFSYALPRFSADHRIDTLVVIESKYSKYTRVNSHVRGHDFFFINVVLFADCKK